MILICNPNRSENVLFEVMITGGCLKLMQKAEDCHVVSVVELLVVIQDTVVV